MVSCATMYFCFAKSTVGATASMALSTASKQHDPVRSPASRNCREFPAACSCQDTWPTSKTRSALGNAAKCDRRRRLCSR